MMVKLLMIVTDDKFFVIVSQPDDTHLVVGMTDGLLSIKVRQIKKETDQSKHVTQFRPGSYKYFIRGANFKAHKVGWFI